MESPHFHVAFTEVVVAVGSGHTVRRRTTRDHRAGGGGNGSSKCAGAFGKLTFT